jgi:hypothetical protein
MATLRDLGPEPFEVVPAGNPPAKARHTWVVLVDNGEPVSAIPPGTALGVSTRLPAIIIADADLAQHFAFQTEPFSTVKDGEHEIKALVLTDREDIVGVIPGEDLLAAIRRGAIRHAGDTVLPGPPKAPEFSRACGHIGNGVTCGSQRKFRGKPSPMPACADPRGLGGHLFGW